MSSQTKYELIEKLVLTDDDFVLDQVKAILEGSELQLWDDLHPGLKESINRGVEQSKQGLGDSHESVMKEFRSRLSK